jgi:hypothetical protein
MSERVTCETCGLELYEIIRRKPYATLKVVHHDDGRHTVKFSKQDGWVLSGLRMEAPEQ